MVRTPTAVIPPGDFLVPTFAIHVDWPWEERSALHAKIYSDLQNSYTGNAAVVCGVGIGGNYQMGQEGTNLTAEVFSPRRAATPAKPRRLGEVRDTGELRRGQLPDPPRSSAGR